MEKKTMGAFIAALRKANGMTQQELADKLNISNKAVSRWERDECAPDISLIPALAEILGVTCDELLKGERILSGSVQEKSEPKVEKQLKALINRAVSNFKTLIWISLALSAVGLICMFGISYGAFRPLIGFIVMCLLAVAAFVVAVICTNKLKDKKNENELFENADEQLIKRYNSTLGKYSYLAFCVAILVVAVSLPYLFFKTENVKSVLNFSSYLTLFGWIIPALVLAFLALKDIYCAWITGQPYKFKKIDIKSKLFLMNMLQWGIVVLSSVLFVIAPDFAADKVWSWEDTLLVIAYFLLPASAVIFIVFISVFKSERKQIALSGIRNLLLIIPAILTVNVHNNEIRYTDSLEIRHSWYLEYLLIALSVALTIFMIFEIIKYCLRRKKEV